MMNLMRQAICAAAVTCVAASASASCVRATEFTVDSLNLTEAHVAPAFEQAARPAGFTVVSHVSTELKLNAEGLGGPLDAVLDLIAEQSDVEYRIEGCKLVLYAKGAAPVDQVFSMRESLELHSELGKWAEAAGWRLVWTLPHTWKVFADTEIRALDAVKATGHVIEILRDEGKPVRLVVYQGNRVMEVVSSDITN